MRPAVIAQLRQIHDIDEIKGLDDEQEILVKVVAHKRLFAENYYLENSENGMCAICPTFEFKHKQIDLLNCIRMVYG